MRANCRWSLIAGRLPGRTDNEIKNYWNTNLSKRVHGDKIDDFNKQYCSKLERKGSMRNMTLESNPESQPVIRTKAVRCTKVIIPWQVDNQMVNKNIVPVWDCDTPSSSAQQGDNNSCGFLKDFDINDLLISGVLYSDDQEKEMDECEIVVDGQDQAKNMSGSCPELDFPEGKIEESMEDEAIGAENWRGSDQEYPFQPNDNDHALDLTTLASFLNSEDEWIS